jgi:hypothetical protein
MAPREPREQRAHGGDCATRPAAGCEPQRCGPALARPRRAPAPPLPSPPPFPAQPSAAPGARPAPTGLWQRWQQHRGVLRRRRVAAQAAAAGAPLPGPGGIDGRAAPPRQSGQRTLCGAALAAASAWRGGGSSGSGGGGGSAGGRSGGAGRAGSSLHPQLGGLPQARLRQPLPAPRNQPWGSEPRTLPASEQQQRQGRQQQWRQEWDKQQQQQQQQQRGAARAPRQVRRLY